MKFVVLLIMSGFLLFSCDKYEEQTIESAYINPIDLPVIHKYNFLRNGTSSVNLLELDILKDNINYFLNPIAGANIFNETIYNEMMSIYTHGLYGVIPLSRVATSELHVVNQPKIQADIEQVITKASFLSGLNAPTHSKYQYKQTAAYKGSMGYLLDGTEKKYVSEKGLVLYNYINGMLMGAIYLDRLLNYHLSDAFLENKLLRNAHENLELISGRNYTELEHHWDLAYGYFNIWRNFFKAEGIISVLDNDQKIFTAFVLGRTELSRYRYTEMQFHLKTIREELSKSLAIGAIYFLTGPNTLANLKYKEGSDAFLNLSKGCGLLYALQFTASANGEPYVQYQQVNNWIMSLLKDDGFWNTTVLLSDELNEGSLSRVVSQIRLHFELAE